MTRRMITFKVVILYDDRDGLVENLSLGELHNDTMEGSSLLHTFEVVNDVELTTEQMDARVIEAGGDPGFFRDFDAEYPTYNDDLIDEEDDDEDLPTE